MILTHESIGTNCGEFGVLLPACMHCIWNSFRNTVMPACDLSEKCMTQNLGNLALSRAVHARHKNSSPLQSITSHHLVACPQMRGSMCSILDDVRATKFQRLWPLSRAFRVLVPMARRQNCHMFRAGDIVGIHGSS